MWLFVWNWRFHNVILQSSNCQLKTADNAILLTFHINVLIEASFTPIFPIKIDTWWLATNKNADALLKDFAFLRLYLRTVKYTVNNIFLGWVFKLKKYSYIGNLYNQVWSISLILPTIEALCRKSRKSTRLDSKDFHFMNLFFNSVF